MKKNQYIISTKNLSSSLSDFNSHQFQEYFVYTHPNLDYSFAESKGISIVILGFIFDPFNPKRTYQEIAHDLTKLETKESFFETIESYSGRFVIIYKNDVSTIILTDCMAQRNAFYWFTNNETYIFSCEKLLLDTLKLKPQIAQEKLDLLEDKVFSKIKGNWLLGEDEWDNRFKKLIPNYYLDLMTKATHRIPIFCTQKLTEEELIKLSSTILTGGIESTTIHFNKVYQALTAGYDSRLLMTAAIPHQEKISFHLFERRSHTTKRDFSIGKKLAKTHKFNYQSITPPQLSENFKKSFYSQFVIPRYASNHRNIEWFLKNTPKKSINITGDGGEVIRTFREARHFNSPKELLNNLSYGLFPYNVNSILNWMEKSKPYIKKYNLLINDMFQLEVSMCKWGARWAHEQDFSEVEEFSPYNNRKLVYATLLNTHLKERSKPEHPFFKKLMESLLPNSTSIPFNPPTWREKAKKMVHYFIKK